MPRDYRRLALILHNMRQKVNVYTAGYYCVYLKFKYFYCHEPPSMKYKLDTYYELFAYKNKTYKIL